MRRHESRNVTFLAPDWPIFWQRAGGVNVWDTDGNRFLDLTSAFGVCGLGHNNAAVCEALTFNPFHSVAAHRPVGIMNEGRNLIYKASRHAAELRDKLEQFSCSDIYPDFERTIAPTAP